ncbi:hypothetical protein B0T24DRAFT_706998 [Lasiosphaeria ovina]|uniref:Protein kinase domain-containing protein n=1 Tax=Lasiosphaeria ovina TaxID=92902 RepID=A0AAE0K3C8_9PEZI|nr:hypothetical protein B0T24DRAFT_706998 [Lasiosphaeria ovina]
MHYITLVTRYRLRLERLRKFILGLGIGDEFEVEIGPEDQYVIKLPRGLSSEEIRQIDDLRASQRWLGQTPFVEDLRPGVGANTRSRPPRKHLKRTNSERNHSTPSLPPPKKVRGDVSPLNSPPLKRCIMAPSPNWDHRPPTTSSWNMPMAVVLSTSSAATTQELVSFWENFTKLADGLNAVHQLRSYHGDIKPSNILVFMRPGSKFGSSFKLADFGVSASHMYSPPESYQHGIIGKEDSNPSLVLGDIWSLGCVFSEAAVWSVMGESGRLEYRQSRLDETNETSLRGTGYNGCFHNGSAALDAVQRMHSLMVTTSRHPDGITHRMSKLIIESMLQSEVLRGSSRMTYERARSVIHDAEEDLRVRPQQVKKPPQLPRVLCLDGGGLRGLSSLFVLRRLLEDATGDAATKPCEFFDMLAGSGTGGQHGLSEYELLRETEDPRCKVLVYAMSSGISNEIRLRSYQTPAPLQASTTLFDCLIREAARDTLAAPTLFDSVTVTNLWGTENPPVVISIGAAQPLSDTALRMNAQKTLGEAAADIADAIAANAELTALQFANNRNPDIAQGRYFRFNPSVNIPLEWDEKKSLEKQTAAYLDDHVDPRYWWICTNTLHHGQLSLSADDVRVLFSSLRISDSSTSSIIQSRRSSNSADTEERIVQFLGTFLMEVPGPIGEMAPQIFLAVVTGLLIQYSHNLERLANMNEERQVARFISKHYESVARNLASSTSNKSEIRRQSFLVQDRSRAARSMKAYLARKNSTNTSPPLPQGKEEDEGQSLSLTHRLEDLLMTDRNRRTRVCPTVRFLLQNNFPVDEKDCQGATALSLANYKLHQDLDPEEQLNLAEIKILLIQTDGTHHVPVSFRSSRNVVASSTLVASFEWEVPSVIQLEINDPSTPLKDPMEALSKIVILTGSRNRYRCTTCAEFMGAEWPDHGGPVLSLIGRALGQLFRAINRRDGGKQGMDEMQSMSVHVSGADHEMKVSMDRITVKMPLAYLTLRDTNRHHIIEALRWLVTAVRRCETKTLQMSSASQRLLSLLPHYLPLISSQLEPLKPLTKDDVGDSDCWVAMFREGIVARHTLTGSLHNWGRGLRIDFDLMVHISAVGVYQMLEDEEGKPVCQVLSGFRTVLVPIDRNPDKKAIRWHFESSAGSGGNEFEAMNAYASELVQANEWLKIQNPEEFHGKTCYVGWSERAVILLGTERRQEKFSISKSVALGQVIELSGFQMNAQANLASVLPIPLNVTIGAQYSFRSTTQAFQPSEEYLSALHQTVSQVALVLDTDSEQAWLVPGLNLHLHMCHRYFSEFKELNEVQEDPIPFAEPSVHGHREALGILQRNGHTLSKMAVWQIFMATGAELQDMVVRPPSGKSPLMEVKDKRMDPWLPLSNLADVVVVCKGLGAAIQPETQGNGVACQCQTMPSSKYYLAAHTWCLGQILQRGRVVQEPGELGKEVCYIDGHRWATNPHKPPWVVCPHGAEQGSVWTNPEFFQNMEGKGNRLVKNSNPPREVGIPDTGVLVFGTTG